MRSEIGEDETIGDLLERMAAEDQNAVGRIYDSVKSEIRPLVVTSLNGMILPRSGILLEHLTDGDQIIWFLVYAGG